MKNLINYIKSPTDTPQSEPIPGSTQVPNSAGGYAWAVDDWTRLDRFLVLGSEGGTYYINERALTRENAEAVLRCIAADGPRAVARIVEISRGGPRAEERPGDLRAGARGRAWATTRPRAAAFDALPRVCRTGTHLFHFAQYVEGLRGWGRGLREAVGGWYAMPAEQAWPTRRSSTSSATAGRTATCCAWRTRSRRRTQHEIIYNWMVKGWEWVGDEPHPDPALRHHLGVRAGQAVRRARRRSSRLIRDYGLPREAMPTEWLNNVEVWEALLAEHADGGDDPQPGEDDRVGLLAPVSDGSPQGGRSSCATPERFRAARLHPIKVLAALKTYAQGHGERGKLTWTPVAADRRRARRRVLPGVRQRSAHQQALAAGARRVGLDGRQHVAACPA